MFLFFLQTRRYEKAVFTHRDGENNFDDETYTEELFMDNRSLKEFRMRQFFINATRKIMDDEGVHAVTIRKIADTAGFNSATIYNYFDDISHLIFCAAMKYLRDYTCDIPRYVTHAINPVEEYLQVWSCFCHHSFHNPQIYHVLFISDLGHVPDDVVKDYYQFFPEELNDLPSELVPMLLESDLTKRTTLSMKKCLDEGWISPHDAEAITDRIVAIYVGMLTAFMNHRVRYTAEDAAHKTMDHIREILLAAVTPPSKK